MNKTLLVARDVHKIYRDHGKEVRAVNGVSMDVEKGKSVAIVGPSGAGKSTLLHMLGALDKPTSGHIILDGVDIYKLPEGSRAYIRNKRVGFVFQFYHLLPEFSALENVMMPGLIMGREVREKAVDALKIVGLEKRMNHKPSELSGGESQRVAIARAIINEPEILLCDEPTGNLDSKASETVYELLFGLKADKTIALIVVTHDEGISRKMDKTIRVKDGKTV